MTRERGGGGRDNDRETRTAEHVERDKTGLAVHGKVTLRRKSAHFEA